MVALRRAGVRAAVFVPLAETWEATIRLRGLDAAAWYEVLPSVYRAPLLTDSQLLALPSIPVRSYSSFSVREAAGDYEALLLDGHLRDKKEVLLDVLQHPELTLPLLEAIAHCVDDEDSTIRHRAVMALGTPTGDVAAQTKILMRVLRAEARLGLGATAARSLRRLGSEHPMVRESLLGLLEDEDGSVRKTASLALAENLDSAEEVLPVLSRILAETSDGDVLAEVAGAIGSYGPAARVLLGVLARKLETVSDVDAAFVIRGAIDDIRCKSAAVPWEDS